MALIVLTIQDTREGGLNIGVLAEPGLDKPGTPAQAAAREILDLIQQRTAAPDAGLVVPDKKIIV